MACSGDASLCDDVVQETYARAVKGLHRIEQDGKLGGYLVGIARNVAVDVARRRGRESAYAAGERGNGEYRGGGGAGSSPSEDAARGELRRRLESAVAALPEDQREIFLMKYVAGMRHGEIARALGTSSVAVSQKLWRVRRKLQRELQEFRP